MRGDSNIYFEEAKMFIKRKEEFLQEGKTEEEKA